jgi:hypothetical protein
LVNDTTAQLSVEPVHGPVGDTFDLVLGHRSVLPQKKAKPYDLGLTVKTAKVEVSHLSPPVCQERSNMSDLEYHPRDTYPARYRIEQ